MTTPDALTYYHPMIRYANLQDARQAVAEWNGNPASVVHLGDHGSSIFAFKNQDGGQQILRFNDPAFRTLPDVIAELQFVNHLYADGVSVAPALATARGSLAIATPHGEFVASSIQWAQGLHVEEGSAHWNDQFFHEWGRNLAQIHQSSVKFQVGKGSPTRWLWKNEILFRNGDQLLPPEDLQSREVMRELLEECETLTQSTAEFGLIHADHAPQNFRYQPEQNRITTFDFGNCCYHWFIADVAISLSTVRRKVNREVIKENLLRGYSSIRSLPSGYERWIDVFIRLRVLYFYLSRLQMWTNPSPQQAEDLIEFRSRVHSRVGWRPR